MNFRDRRLNQRQDFVKNVDDEVIQRFDAQLSLISRIDDSFLAKNASLDRILIEVCSDLVKALDINAATIAIPLVDGFAPISDDDLARQVGSVVQQRRSELLALLPGSSLVIRDELPASINALCCLPIVVQDKTFGLLLVACRAESQALLLDTDTIPYASVVATRIGVMLKHFLELRSSELRWSLVQVFFDSTLDSTACWNKIIERVSAFLPDWGPLLIRPAPKVQLLSFNEGDKRLSIIGTQGDEMPGTEVLVDFSICGMLVQDRSSPFIVVNPRDYPDRYQGFLLNDSSAIPRSELAVSVMHKGKMIGVVTLEHLQPDAFQSQHIDAVMTASADLAPFLAALRERHDKQRSQELGILYTMNDLLTRTASTYQHLLGQPMLDMRLTLEKLAKELARKSPDGLRMVDHLQTQIDRIGVSSDRFCYALTSGIKYGPVNVTKVVTNALSIFNTERLKREENIAIDLDIADDVKDVYASELLSEHIHNLVDNSLYAVRAARVERGAIRIGVTRREAKDTLRQSTASRLVEIRISDNGTGVPKKQEHRIGTPGVTTKGSHGTGYGLSAAKDYVQSIGGTLRTENTPGRGFVVEIVLGEYNESKYPKRGTSVAEGESPDY